MAVKKQIPGRYIALFSIHGLIRGSNLELGRDADTGGQTKYVVELARKLAAEADVDRVDLFTRLIVDKRVDTSYAKSIEALGENAHIVRIQGGPRRYLRKELLWPYLDSFADNTIRYFRELGRLPDVIHGHYADAGYVGANLARLLGVPFFFTGHSLGRVKRERLAEKGLSEIEMRARYNIHHRIEAEESALVTAEKIVVSTQQEIDEQYELYEYYDRRRKVIIPPGIAIERFHPRLQGVWRTPIYRQLERFLKEPRRPMVLALSRADERKNIEGLVHAFAGNAFLRENCNLVLIAGNRDDLRNLDSGARKVLNQLLYLIDKYDLYGQVAYPKQHRPDDVPDLYRLAAKSKGVFVNPALTEPFGLTLLEAAASGLPLVATHDGGPQVILANCENGFLVDPLKSGEIATAIERIISSPELWSLLSGNGIRNVRKFYSWQAHTRKYMGEINKVLKRKHYRKKPMPDKKSRLPVVKKMIITDIDNTLVGDDAALARFKQLRAGLPEDIALGVATGRRLELTVEAMNDYEISIPDLLITSVGTEIYYGEKLVYDKGWHNHINYLWKPERIREVLAEVPGLTLQEDEAQRRYKVSYFVDSKLAPPKREITSLLRAKRLKVKAIFSHKSFLDVLPIRASKGLAIRYLLWKWGLAPEAVLVAGDSGNDEEMLRGNTLGVVVGNYDRELQHLFGKPRIYFASEGYAAGIIEGIEYYNFLGQVRNLEPQDD
jgi:sucrose-phosphate synthase